ncbi:MAG: hypothetical protein ABEN55_09495 [Bradymonadaceae bacterium]
MPLSTVYNVVTRYRVDDDGASEKVDRLAGSFGRLWDQAKWIIGGGLALGAGLGIQRMVQLGTQAEKARISIAGTFQVLEDEASTFNEQLERADDLFKRFSKRSITSPASRQEFRTLFQGLAPAIGGLDVDNEQIAQFTQRSVGAAVAFTDQDYQQAGRDLRRILKGRAGADVKTFSNLKQPLLEAMGAESVEEFNRLAEANPAKTFEALNKVLKQTDPMLEAFSESTSGLFATLKELVNRGLLQAWEGFGEALREEMEAAIDWFMENRGAVKETARELGDDLGDALHGLVDTAQLAYRNLDDIKAALGSLAALRISSQLGGEKMAKHLFVGTRNALASKIGSVGLFGKSGLIGSIIAGGTTAAVALAAIAAAGVAVADAVEIMRTETSKLRQNNRDLAAASKGFFSDKWRGFIRSLKRLGDVLGIVNAETGEMQNVGSSLLYLGGIVLETAEILVQGLNLVVATLKYAAFGTLSLIEMLVNQTVGQLPGATPDRTWQRTTQEAIDEMGRILTDIRTAWGPGARRRRRPPRRGPTMAPYAPKQFTEDFVFFGPGRPTFQSMAAKAASKTKEDQNQGGGDTNIDVEINQEISTEADPDRIAFKTEDAVSKGVSKAKPSTATAPPFGS